ncbi:MAG TPA: DUF3551 domain-containing protein [Xanthobacteraceae bacterium]|jgi:hypothetical protein
MKALFAGSVLLAAIGMQAGTFAQAQTATVYQYCLLERSGGGRGTGGEAMLCRFNTLAQCMASKTGNTDTCIVNPQLAVPRK